MKLLKWRKECDIISGCKQARITRESRPYQPGEQRVPELEVRYSEGGFPIRGLSLRSLYCTDRVDEWVLRDGRL